MTDAKLPPREPGPEPDTTTAAEPEDDDDRLDAENAPLLVEADGSVDDEH